MPLLYYWQRENYRRDLDMGAGYHLNQANPIMHEVYLGQSLWAFTRAPDGRYALAAELVTRAKTINPPKFRYGRYRVWGDLTASRYFQVDGQPNVELILRGLSPKMNAAHLGQSFQDFAAVRRATLDDHMILTAAGKHLPLEPRACILPEERLEAAYLLGNEEAVEELVSEQPSGVAEKRRAYLYGPAITRNADLVRQLQEMCDNSRRQSVGLLPAAQAKPLTEAGATLDFHHSHVIPGQIDSFSLIMTVSMRWRLPVMGLSQTRPICSKPSPSVGSPAKTNSR